jgi:hypothetical protein
VRLWHLKITKQKNKKKLASSSLLRVLLSHFFLSVFLKDKLCRGKLIPLLDYVIKHNAEGEKKRKKSDPSSRRREGPISKHISGHGKNIIMVMRPYGARNQEYPYWRKPAANYCSCLVYSMKAYESVDSVKPCKFAAGDTAPDIHWIGGARWAPEPVWTLWM